MRAVPRWWRDASIAAFWTVLLVVTALWVTGGGLPELGSAAGLLTSVGRITGLIASALLLVQVFLMARVPWFEQSWGHDRLARIHRTVGFSSFSLLWAHIVLITLGYAASAGGGTSSSMGPGLWSQLWATIVGFVVDYPGMLLAVAGTVALCLVVVTSVRRARSRLRYESWHLIHLYGYLGAGLVLPHQLWTGQDFLDSSAATVFWWALYVVCAAAVLVFRVGVPLGRWLRSDARVVDVRSAGPAAVTVTVAGPGVRRLAARSGQFFIWRFLDGHGWSRSNPYSLSAAPVGDTLRLTANIVGDGSARLATLRPGTRVLLEGPFGRMHGGVRSRRRVLLMAAGIGIAPMRALLEDLPQQAGDITVVHRVGSLESAVLVGEMAALARERGAGYVVIDGPRTTARASWLPARLSEQMTDMQALQRLVPDVAQRDVYLCGHPDWMAAATAALRRAGVSSDHIHAELFAY